MSGSDYSMTPGVGYLDLDTGALDAGDALGGGGLDGDRLNLEVSASRLNSLPDASNASIDVLPPGSTVDPSHAVSCNQAADGVFGCIAVD